MINIYCISIRALPENYGALMQLISDDRRKRINRFCNKDDKLRCLAAGILISRVICNQNPESSVILYNEYGKPYIENKPCFNISHSGDYVIMAAGEKPMGIDIEKNTKNTRDYLRIAKTAFHPAEFEFLKNSSNLEEDFFVLWTLKESFMKAQGRGFNLAPKSFYFDINDGIKLYSDIPNDYKFTVLKNIKGYTVSLCASEGTDTDIKFLNI